MAGAYKVQYSHTYPAIRMPGEPEREVLVKAMLTKPIDWQYEAEYRVIALEFAEGDDSEWVPRARDGMVTLAHDAFIGVIMGASASDTDRHAALELIRGAPRKLELWRATLRPDLYELKIEREY